MSRETDLLHAIQRQARTTVEIPCFHRLFTPITAAAWTGTTHSTTAKTLIDLSAVFVGVPAYVKMIDAHVCIKDSGSAANDCYFILSPIATAGIGRYTRCSGLANSAYTNANFWVSCNTDGDLYFQINASGANTMTIYFEIHGWVI